MKSRIAVSAAVGCLVWTSAAHSQAPGTLAELWAIVEQQQSRIGELEARLAEYEGELAAAERSLDTTGVALEATAVAVERLQASSSEPSRTSIGGYGELHYNNLDAADSANDLDEIDFHRFVTFLSHRFNDRIAFFSELEVEHSLAGDGAPGEVEVEQAYVEFGLDGGVSAKTGLFLLPVGILNETHEPPTFYGVERNNVESVILPSTWWEAGGGLSGATERGIGWDVAVHSGLAIPTTGSNAFRVRSGRQKVAEALASDFAVTGRLRYNGFEGLELAASLQYQSDPSQLPGDGLDAGRLLTAHAIYTRGSFALRSLYARWDFDGDAVEAAAADEQSGLYVEPSYRFGGDMSRWGIYARFEDVEGAADADEFRQREVGFNYWPIDAVTLKFTYRDRDYDLDSLAGRDFDGFDLGFGYQF